MILILDSLQASVARNTQVFVVFLGCAWDY